MVYYAQLISRGHATTQCILKEHELLFGDNNTIGFQYFYFGCFLGMR